MFKEIKVSEIQDNPFKLIGKDWMLITAGNEEKVNAMTASWGGVGVMWGKPAATCYIRPQRYTKTFVDREERFSLAFFDDSYRKMLNYMGSVSGADEDKIKGSGLNVSMVDGVPVFEEAKLVLICRKQFAQRLDPENMIDPEIDGKWYPDKDYHTMYIAQIEKVLIKE